ncbi:hypothetical protein [Zoogloea dura]|jgi:hypothetical protein|uniref:Uncharacterized protein n=1 Tax=Zoogloea dura TaxID=2728840 RepID=A0A848FXP6_9RHOO|nr:hypothetical protein [Zoogloea dura]NML24717.1 hypothetical protein [Zoogloea dura]
MLSEAGVALALLAGIALAPRLPHLRRRYDTAALQALTRRPDANPGDERLKLELAAWARTGAGNGATLLPWQRPRVPLPLAIRSVEGRHENTLVHFAYRLAGYHQLDERSRLGGLIYRIGVQLRPLLWFAPRRPGTPWDDCWLTAVDAPRLLALARWRPRRPTLIVLDRLQPAEVSRVMEALTHAASLADQPIRVVVLSRDNQAGKTPSQRKAQRKG